MPLADEERDDEEDYQHEPDRSEHLYPERSAGARIAAVRRFVATLLRILHLAHSPCLAHPEETILRYIASLSSHDVSQTTYTRRVPRLWDATIDAHRRAVRDATLDVAAGLVAKHGLRAVTMSQIAAGAGIGRATLYKYFPDVESILVAWHERQLGSHLAQLTDLRDGAEDPTKALESVLEEYALIRHEHDRTELASLLHRGQHIARASDQLTDLIRGILVEGVEDGTIRDDVAPDELARFCIHALAAAGSLRSRAAVRRLVGVTLSGMRPQA